MRSLMFIAALVLVVSGMSAGGDSAFFHLEKTSRNGTVHFIGKNISHSPIVAYVVVVVERSRQRAIWQGVYTGGDALEADKTVDLGDAPAGSGDAQVFVDYVRLADGAAWGGASTDEAKAVAARFQK